MSIQLQLRRGTTAENQSFKGALGEVTVDTTTHQLRVHDNSITGGYIIPTTSEVVHKTGDESITGVKTFSNLPVTPAMANCLTTIPQDINLTVSGNVLTIKSGTKTYTPAGSGVFNINTSTADTTKDYTDSSNGTYVQFKSNWTSIAKCVSGSTDSLAGTAWHIWYDTTNNQVKVYTSDPSTPSETDSLPIAIVTKTSSGITIDQVFNGLGYIGSTAFALPGVKGLIPNGRNSDGSLKNTAFTVSNVITRTFESSFTGNCYYLGFNSFIISFVSNVYYYDSANNYNINGTAGVWTYSVVATFSLTSGVISNWNPKPCFHAVDYSEADFVVAFQRPTSANNYTWYRKYKSGWVEQGQKSVSAANGTVQTITLPVTMADTNYSAMAWCTQISSSSGFGAASTVSCGAGTTTQIYLSQNNTFSTTMCVGWQVSGMYAQ